jgi:hypothetical protein
MSADMMTKGERENLARLIRQRAKLGKTTASQRAAELRAELEQQLDRRYSFDDDAVWNEAYTAAEQAVAQAKVAIAKRCEQLGIPEQFRPDIGSGWWRERGRNSTKSERAEMRRLGYVAIEALEKKARTEIDRAAVELETELVAGSLTSDAAHAFLARIPDVRALMPVLDVKALALK